MVSGGETFYNLTRKFKISEDSIKLLNGGLPQGLRTGDTLKLSISPELKKKFENTVNASQQTKDSIATNIKIEIPAIVGGEKKDVYNVGLFLPF